MSDKDIKDARTLGMMRASENFAAFLSGRGSPEMPSQSTSASAAPRAPTAAKRVQFSDKPSWYDGGVSGPAAGFGPHEAANAPAASAPAVPTSVPRSSPSAAWRWSAQGRGQGAGAPGPQPFGQTQDTRQPVKAPEPKPMTVGMGLVPPLPLSFAHNAREDSLTLLFGTSPRSNPVAAGTLGYGREPKMPGGYLVAPLGLLSKKYSLDNLLPRAKPAITTAMAALANAPMLTPVGAGTPFGRGLTSRHSPARFAVGVWPSPARDFDTVSGLSTAR